MSHEMSKAHQNQVAEKAAIIANTAFKLGRESERNRIIVLLTNELQLHSKGSTGRGNIERVIAIISREETNDGSN
jgi:hypothetical protein